MKKKYTDEIVWQDGKFITLNKASVDLLTHSLHYGVSVFEGVRCYQTEKGPAIFRLNDHSKRLLRSAHILNMQVPFSEAVLNEAQRELIARNGLKNAYIRPLVYYDGQGYIGLHLRHVKTCVAIATWDWRNYLTDQQYQEGIHVRTASFARYHPNSLLGKAKSSGKYISTVMALQEASRSGVDDAIFLDQQGYVSEGTGANIFMVRDKVIYTPETTTALEGITRDTIFKFIQDSPYSIEERRFSRGELYIADEVFFSGTAAQIVAITQVDDRTIGAGTIGPITRWLIEQYDDCVHGRKSDYSQWLTYI